MHQQPIPAKVCLWIPEAFSLACTVFLGHPLLLSMPCTNNRFRQRFVSGFRRLSHLPAPCSSVIHCCFRCHAPTTDSGKGLSLDSGGFLTCLHRVPRSSTAAFDAMHQQPIPAKVCLWIPEAFSLA